MSFAILQGRNSCRHEVDFGDDRITVDLASSESTVQITVDMPAFPAPSHRRPFATLAVPRDALLAALHASPGPSGPGPGHIPLRIVSNDAGYGA